VDLQHFKRNPDSGNFRCGDCVAVDGRSTVSDIRKQQPQCEHDVQNDAGSPRRTLVNKLLVDEESGLRGLPARPEMPRFLEPFDKAHAFLDKEFEALENVPGADQREQDHVKT